MTHLLRTATLLLATLGSFGVPWTSGVAIAAQSSLSETAKALRLADLVTPSTDAELAIAQSAVLAAMAKEAPNMEKETPGLMQAMWDAMEPVMRADSNAERPAFLAKIANIYQTRRTEPQIDAALQFYSGESGRKLIRAMSEGLDFSTLAAEAANADTKDTMSKKAFDTMLAGGKAEATKSLRLDDMAPLIELTRSIPPSELAAIGQEVQKFVFEYINAPDPELDAALEKASESALEKYQAE